MWQSALLLAKGIARHWLQALGGALMAVVGLVSQIRSWIVPPGVWLALSGVLFLWAILETVHELRLRLPTEPSLVGRFFHTFHPSGTFQYQGEVLREKDGRLFV